MRRHRKSGRWKLVALLALAVAGLTTFLLLTVRAPEEQSRRAELLPEGAHAGRKNIYDRHYRELAVSSLLTSVYARPLELREPEMIASQFATILGQDENELLRALRSERSFVWLARRLDAEKSSRVSGLKTRGLYYFDEEQRVYPNRELGAHVLGFLGNEHGLAGIEFHYEQLLLGGWGAEQNVLSGLPSSVDTEKGVHLVLTLDLPVQAFLEQELARLKEETGAASAMALVLEPASGEIHALVSLPAFDPNLFWRYSTSERRNRILTDPVFPGSLWKFFRHAAAIDAGREVYGKEDPEAESVPKERKMPARSKAAGSIHEDWVELAPGVHGTPSLALLPDFELSPEELATFAGKVRLTGDLDLDLPKGLDNGETWERTAVAGQLEMNIPTTGFHLLTAFTRLIANGDTARPHLLKAVVDEKGEEIPLSYDRHPPAVSASARQSVSGILFSGPSGSGRPAGVVESLIVRPSGEGPDAEGACRQQNLLAGFVPGSSPLAFLLVLDGACVDVNRPSKLRLLGQRFARQLDDLHQEWPGGLPGKAGEGGYRRWHDLHQPQVPEVEKQLLQEERMADVRGLGVRQALQVLQSYGLEVQISGSGRVVGQQPKPGSPLVGAREIRLELRPNHE